MATAVGNIKQLKTFDAWIHLLPRLISALVVAKGFLILTQWGTGFEMFHVPGHDDVWPLTAIAMTFAGASLWTLAETGGSRLRQNVGYGLALITLIISMLMFSETVFSTNLMIDQALFPKAIDDTFSQGVPASVHPGRMAPNTALELILISAALLLINRGTSRKFHLGQVLAIMASLISLLALIGHIYGIEGLYEIRSHAPMSVTSAVVLGALCLGILLARPQTHLMAGVTSGAEEAALSRQLLLAAVLVPILLSWLIATGYYLGLYSALQATSYVAIANILFFAVLVWHCSNRLHQIERRRAQIKRSLNHSMALLRATLESTADGILAVNSRGTISTYNQRFLEMWKIPLEVAASLQDETLIRYAADQLKDPEAFLKKVVTLYADPLAVSNDILEFKDGRVFERHSMPRRIAGKHVGRVWSFRDITHRRQLESRLQEAIKDREEILGIVSHDLKNPLGAILMNAQLLEKSSEPGSRVHRQAQIIGMAADQMNHLIRDLLDQARIEAGKLTVEQTPHSVRDLLKSACEILIPLAERKHVQLEFPEVEQDLRAFCDRERALQVLSNIVGNAIKFTPPSGRVQVRVHHRDDELHFSVSDTGPGIPRAQQERIFLRFWQAPEAKKHAGAGLGLTISRGIIESHGGKIWVESEPGCGSTFHFTLPRAASQSQTPHGDKTAA